MNRKSGKFAGALRHDKVITVVLAAIGAVALYLWIRPEPAAHLAMRIPATMDAAELPRQTDEPIKPDGHLVKYDGVAAELQGGWPRFRGENYDAISAENIVLAQDWPDDGPPVLWRIKVGRGYAAAAVLGGRVYMIDYDQEKKADAIRCLSLGDGREIWRFWYNVSIKQNHGMSRTIPTVTAEHVVTIGPKCHVTCLDSVTGNLRWMYNLPRQFKATVPPWYAGQCPLIDDGKAIIAVGGEVLMMAVDCATGAIIWKTPNQHDWDMTHSSPIPVDFKGRRIYVYCASKAVVGVSSEDGSILWQYPDWQIRVANIPTPVLVEEDRLFLSGGYNAGSIMLQLSEEKGEINVRKLFSLKPEVFGSQQQTPVFYAGYIYGVRPDGRLTCIDLEGNTVWASSSADRFGLGPYMIADGKIYAMDDSGVLTVARATATEYVQLDRAKVLDGPESWGPMAVAGGRLIIRDMEEMICLDITKRQ